MKKRNKTLIAILILSLTSIFMMISCKEKPNSNLEVKNLTINKADGSSVTVKAEIADTDESRQFGFMEREKIPDGTGMLFVFDRDQVLSFWMKNTPHPLSIAYIDSRGKIIWLVNHRINNTNRITDRTIKIIRLRYTGEAKSEK